MHVLTLLSRLVQSDPNWCSLHSLGPYSSLTYLLSTFWSQRLSLWSSKIYDSILLQALASAAPSAPRPSFGRLLLITASAQMSSPRSLLWPRELSKPTLPLPATLEHTTSFTAWLPQITLLIDPFICLLCISPNKITTPWKQWVHNSISSTRPEPGA